MSTSNCLFPCLGGTALLISLLAPSALGAQGGAFSSNPLFEITQQHSSMSQTGDLNGDGFDDFILGHTSTSPNGVLDAGSAYIYSVSTGSILYQIDGSYERGFLGSSVSGAGDVNGDGFEDFIIGAPTEDPNGFEHAGSVYVYSGVSGNLIHQFDGQSPSTFLGGSVAAVGDVDGDGYSDVAMGGMFPEQVLVYSGKNGSLVHHFFGANPYDHFNDSVEGAGDVNGDGFDDIIIGARGADPNGLDWAGSAYVYSGSTGSLLYQFDGSEAKGTFGSAVSGAGDVDGDGFADVIIGAPHQSSQTPVNAGKVYVYSGATGAMLYQFDGNFYHGFLGQSVSSAGDLDEDGFSDLIFGGGGLYIHGAYGEVHVISGKLGSVIQSFIGDASKTFGRLVSGGGDMNGDGCPDVIFEGSPGVLVHPFFRGMTVNSNSISAASGGTLDFQIEFPPEAAFDEYKVLISISGIGPGHYGVDIPLTLDALVKETFQGIYPFAIHAGMQGFLDASAKSTANATISPGALSNVVGLTAYFAAIANQPGQLPEFSSVVQRVTVEI